MRGEFFRASVARLIAVAAAFASGLANLKLYGHFFSPDVYGVMIVALQLIGYLPVLDGGFRMATNRRLLAAEDSTRDSLIRFSQAIYSWLLLVGSVVGVAVMTGYAWLPRHDPAGGWSVPLFLTLGAAGALSMFAAAQSGLLLGLGRQAAMCVVTSVSSVTGVAALAGALFNGFGLWAFPLSLLASSAVTYVLSVIFLRTQRREIPLFSFTLDADFRRRFAEIRPDAWLAFRSQISIVLVFSSDLILASFFCRPAEVAVYGVLSRVLSIVRGFLQVFNESAWPFIAARAQGFERFQDWIVRANSWLYGLAAGGLVGLLPWFIGWYMGPDWTPPALLCWLFVARFLVIGTSGPMSYFLLGKGDFRSVARCTEREVVLSLALSLLLGPWFGLSGIAVAFLLGTAGGSMLPFWVIYVRLRGQKLLPLLATAWFRALLGFGVGWAVGQFLLGHLPTTPLVPPR